MSNYSREMNRELERQLMSLAKLMEETLYASRSTVIQMNLPIRRTPAMEPVRESSSESMTSASHLRERIPYLTITVELGHRDYDSPSRRDVPSHFERSLSDTMEALRYAAMTVLGSTKLDPSLLTVSKPSGKAKPSTAPAASSCKVTAPLSLPATSATQSLIASESFLIRRDK